MKFTPNYTVSYHGKFLKAGVTTDIDPADRDMMAAHGVVEAVTESKTTTAESYPTEPQKPARRGGRPRKGATA